MPSKQQKNMTHLEAAGQRWCQNAVKKRKIYITKVDKGGCILILCAEKVHEIMIETLNEEEMFQELKEDPRDYIKKLIKDTICEYGESGLLSPRDVFSICGVTEKGGMSHGHEFAVRKPYMYPLFKLHKLNEEKILQKIIPPTRMVTSGVGGPTYKSPWYIP